jgi:small subunit ribosomal protein S7
MSADDAEAEADAEPEPEEVATALLFERWDVTDIEFSDPSTERYITLTPIAHTMGRHSDKQFKKSDISIVERLINRLMQTDENTGKKQLTMRIVRESFDLIHERTDENPVQVLVEAVENSAPREETVRLKYGGISVPKAVDISPQRRVDQALMFLAQGVQKSTYKSPTEAEEALASQLIGAANNDVGTYAVNQKEEKERVAAAAR